MNNLLQKYNEIHGLHCSIIIIHLAVSIDLLLQNLGAPREQSSKEREKSDYPQVWWAHQEHMGISQWKPS